MNIFSSPKTKKTGLGDACIDEVRKYLLVFPDCRQDNDLWIKLQNYQDEDWLNLIGLWKYYNLHIIHLINAVDLSKLDSYWCDFEGTKVTLKEMIDGYLDHLILHINEIHDLIDA